MVKEQRGAQKHRDRQAAAILLKYLPNLETYLFQAWHDTCHTLMQPFQLASPLALFSFLFGFSFSFHFPFPPHNNKLRTERDIHSHSHSPFPLSSDLRTYPTLLSIYAVVLSLYLHACTWVSVL